MYQVGSETPYMQHLIQSQPLYQVGRIYLTAIYIEPRDNME